MPTISVTEPIELGSLPKFRIRTGTPIGSSVSDPSGRAQPTDDRPWSELHKGKPLTEITLAQSLRPYGIRPKTLWLDGKAAKGVRHR